MSYWLAGDKLDAPTATLCDGRPERSRAEIGADGLARAMFCWLRFPCKTVRRSLEAVETPTMEHLAPSLTSNQKEVRRNQVANPAETCQFNVRP
jgi:hypothetical protein